MKEKEHIQELNYAELISFKINSIQARFVAFKLAEIDAEIETLEEVDKNLIKILCKKGAYLVTLPNIPIPDAKIELM